MSIPQKPLILLVLDGFGVPDSPGNPFLKARRPNFEYIEKFFPLTTLQASGVAVGLPWGEEGNSEVGHLTMGAGKAIYHHLPRIIVSIQDGSFFENKALVEASRHVKSFSSKFHIMGIFSSGSVHSYADHLYALLEFAKEKELQNVYLHLFTDGRDAPPREAETFFQELEERLTKKYPFVKIASVIGRNFSMDRDGHWDKIEKTYRLLTKGEGREFLKASSYIKEEYDSGRTDEFLEGGYLKKNDGGSEGRIERGDAVIFMNFREDSARELTEAFVSESFDKFGRERVPNLFFVTMTEYEKNLKAEVAFPPLDISWPLARVISEAGLKQLHVAETEKYAHVTYFFNGGKENPFPGEKRILIPSLPGANFEENPEMSAPRITETILENIPEYDFILANFANGDMVGHTGNFEATVKAIEILDDAVGKIIAPILNEDGAVIITGDHGNAEEKRYLQTGEKRTKHTDNPVPFYLVSSDFKRKKERNQEEILKKYDSASGVLSDVAPTVIELMGLSVPSEMTGISLVSKLTAGEK